MSDIPILKKHKKEWGIKEERAKVEELKQMRKRKKNNEEEE